MTEAGPPPVSERDDTALRIWLADLRVLAPALESIEATASLLAPSERAWTNTETTPIAADVRRRRRLTRIALRLLLVRCGASEAFGAELITDGHGKPALGQTPIHFNASHTADMALVAIAGRGPVGVDLETNRTVQLGPERRALIVAAGRALIGASAADDDGCDAGPSCISEFLIAWTRLEAFAKARGDGIGALLTELRITAGEFRHQSSLDIATRCATLLDASGLTVASLGMPAGLFAAIAASGELAPQACQVTALRIDDCRLP